MKEDISPEERLLKLIRGKDKKSLKSVKAEKILPTPKLDQVYDKVAKEKKEEVLTKENILSAPSRLRGKWIERYSNVKFAKNLLLIIFVFLFLFLLIDFFISGPYRWSSNRILQIIESESEVKKPVTEEREELISLADLVFARKY